MTEYATVGRVDLVERRVESRLDELSGQIGSVKEDVTAIGNTVLDLREGQRRLETKVEQLDTKVGQLDTKVGQLDTKVERMDGELRWVHANMRAMMGHFGVPEVEAAAHPDQA